MSTHRQSAVHRALGDAFHKLPAEVQKTHDNGGSLRLAGTADVEVAPGIVPKLICWAVGLPREGANQAVSVQFETDERGTDRWVRNFSGRIYRSTMRAGTRAGEGKLVERLGLFTTTFNLAAYPDRLTFDIVGFKVLGLPMPSPLAVSCHASETGNGVYFFFDITIEVGFLGKLIRYRGRLR